MWISIFETSYVYVGYRGESLDLYNFLINEPIEMKQTNCKVEQMATHQLKLHSNWLSRF